MCGAGARAAGAAAPGPGDGCRARPGPRSHRGRRPRPIGGIAAGRGGSAGAERRRGRRGGAGARTTAVNLVVRNTRRLVTCDATLGEGPLGVIPDGALVATHGRIVWVGPESYLRTVAPRGAVELDAGGRAVVPGLVECHTHLVFAGDRGPEFAARMRGDSYRAGGIMTTVRATRAASDAELQALAQERVARFRSFGVTTLEAKSGYGLELAQELRLLRIASQLDGVVPTLLAAHIVPAEFSHRSDQYVDLVCGSIVPADVGLAAFCDVWCEPEGAFSVMQSRRVLEAGLAVGMRPKVHADQLSHAGGSALA